MRQGTVLPPLDLVRQAHALGGPARSRTEARTRRLVDDMLERRGAFGITRVGCVTRLDRIGIPVVQVVRPLSRSNAVSQGKGLTLAEAAASALMEELEVWAGEEILSQASRKATAEELGPEVRALYGPSLAGGAPAEWQKVPLRWLPALDLLTGREWPVPAALVDTVYTIPSPHPHVFPRTTTGLGAGITIADAILQGALEILERHGVARAHGMPNFFSRNQVDLNTVDGYASCRILDRIRAAGLLTGIWHVPAGHDLPIYWCHIMEPDGGGELAPLPAAGFGCDRTHDGALAKALLEACQARLTAISGAREDVTRAVYPRAFDRPHLAAWREQLRAPGRAKTFPAGRAEDALTLDDVLGAIEREGARSVLAIPLYHDETIGVCAVRVVAPPLRPAPGA